MTIDLLTGLMACAPAASLLVSWPRRRWAAWAVAFGGGAAWLVSLGLMPGAAQIVWIGAGLWAAFGALYAAYVATRNQSEYEKLDYLLKERSQRHGDLREALSRAKSEGSKIEGEQKEVTALYGMVKGLAEALSWDEVRPKLEMAVRQYLGVEEFALYVADLRRPSELHPLVIRHMGQSIGASWDTLSRYLEERKIPLEAPHIMDWPEHALALPIRDTNEIMGYLFVRVPSGQDSQAMLRKVMSFTEEIAFAFSRIKLFQELERLSQIDGLTGVYRRGVLDQRLQEELTRARTFKTTFCLMLLDIDHFKRLNDAYGHPFGDQVLRRVGEILKTSIYDTDFVARYGGEEFAVLLPRADPEGVLRKAETIRAAVEREEFRIVQEKIGVTLSIGIAHYPRDGDSVERIVRQSDRALYCAKENGRNRAVDVIHAREP